LIDEPPNIETNTECSLDLPNQFETKNFRVRCIGSIGFSLYRSGSCMNFVVLKNPALFTNSKIKLNRSSQIEGAHYTYKNVNQYTIEHLKFTKLKVRKKCLSAHFISALTKATHLTPTKLFKKLKILRFNFRKQTTKIKRRKN